MNEGSRDWGNESECDLDGDLFWRLFDRLHCQLYRIESVEQQPLLFWNGEWNHT